MTDKESSIGRPPTTLEVVVDRGFRGLTGAFAWLTILLVVFLVWQIGATASPAIQKYGLKFLTSDKWDKNDAGVAVQLKGTLYSSFLGVAIGTVFGLAVAIFLTQDFLPPRWEWPLRNIVDLLAAIPSVVYGLWGIFVVIPAIRPTADWLHNHLGWFPLFSTRLSSLGMLPAALVLAIMVLPTITAISRDALKAVPNKIREAAFGLGATRWETILAVIVPTASRGIYGAVILGLGRALGETMALAMLVGSSPEFSWSLFSPSDTLAAMLANKFPEAPDQSEIANLMYAALVLLAITLLVNILGTLIVQRSSVQKGVVK
jgi:phosphate transport system permease protein